MKRLAIAVASLLALTSIGHAQQTWRFWKPGLRTSRTDNATFERGVRLCFANWNRYFEPTYREVSYREQADVYVNVGDLRPWRVSNRTAAYIAPQWIVFGLHAGGDHEHVFMTCSHEMTHHWGLNLHRWNGPLRGNFVIGQNASRNWTKTDVAYLRGRGVRLRPNVTPPWEDLLWWRQPNPDPPKPEPDPNPDKPLVSWTNDPKRCEGCNGPPEDVSGDGRVTSRDALLVTNRIGQSVDRSKAASATINGRVQRIFPDVDADGKITADDANQVRRYLAREVNSRQVIAF